MLYHLYYQIYLLTPSQHQHQQGKAPRTGDDHRALHHSVRELPPVQPQHWLEVSQGRRPFPVVQARQVYHGVEAGVQGYITIADLPVHH